MSVIIGRVMKWHVVECLYTLWRSVTIWITLLEFVKLLFVNVMQLCKSICGAWILDVVFNATNLCEPQRKLCDMKTQSVTNDLWRKTFRRAYVLCRTLETLAM